MNKIVFLDASTLGEMAEINALTEFGELVLYSETATTQVLERSKDATIIITNKVILNAAILDQLPALRLICVAATGMNNIDHKKAEALNIQVKNVKGYSTASVTQLTFGYIIELYNNISYYNTYVKDGSYSKQQLFTHIGPGLEEIAGKTIGIIGMGDIGKSVASVAKAFQMDVIYYSTSGKNRDAGYECVPFEELLTRSDIISIHAPLNAETKDLIQYESLSKMKTSAVLINVGRGGIVNEADIARALKERIISGAALDVFEQEPLSKASPLLGFKEDSRLLLSPHIAWASKQSRLKLLDGIKENIRQWSLVNNI